MTQQALSSQPRAEWNGTTYDPRTPTAVCAALESARRDGTRVRLFYGNTETGEAWAEENDVAGTIGRSTGTSKIPLLIPSARSSGGPGILDHCIVAIAIGPNAWAYRHPSFTVGEWKMLRSDWSNDPRPFLVNHNGKAHAAFTKEAGAKRYVEFMRGERMAK